MGLVSYYVAASIDGFIAKPDDSLDWLNHIPQHNSFEVLGGGQEDLFEYHNFYKTVDVMVMGRRTFEVMLGFAEYPYPEKKAYVCTRDVNFAREIPSAIVTGEDPGVLVNKLKKEFKQRVWVVGGGSLASSLMKSGAIDEIILTVIPTVLGKGIRLFQEGDFEIDWERKEVVALSNGLTQMHFLKKTK